MTKHSFLVIVIAAGLATTGCGGDDMRSATVHAASTEPAGTVLKVNAAASGSGAFHFDVKRLHAAAGRVTVEFANGDRFPHNVRIQTGATCCFKDGFHDVGGTDTIDAGTTTKATLRLRPGRYVFLCSIGGHWNGDTGRMRGSLVVS